MVASGSEQPETEISFSGNGKQNQTERTSSLAAAVLSLPISRCQVQSIVQLLNKRGGAICRNRSRDVPVIAARNQFLDALHGAGHGGADLGIKHCAPLGRDGERRGFGLPDGRLSSGQ